MSNNNEVANRGVSPDLSMSVRVLRVIMVSKQRRVIQLILDSVGIWEYIQSTRDQVIDLETRVQKAKNNVDEIVKLMSTWSKAPLFTRKEEKNDTLLNLTDREERLNKRYTEIKTVGDQIHGILKVTFPLRKQAYSNILKILPPKMTILR